VTACAAVLCVAVVAAVVAVVAAVVAVVAAVVAVAAAVVVLVVATAFVAVALVDAEPVAAFSAKPPVRPATATTLAKRVTRRAPRAG
jgi:hypothetical protein